MDLVLNDNVIKHVEKEAITKVSASMKDDLVEGILYGSYARGDFRPDSDIDVMILVDTDRAGVSPLEKKICDVTYDFNDEHGTDIMPVVQSNTHFDYWKKADMFYRNVEKDGVVI